MKIKRANAQERTTMKTSAVILPIADQFAQIMLDSQQCQFQVVENGNAKTYTAQFAAGQAIKITVTGGRKVTSVVFKLRKGNVLTDAVDATYRNMFSRAMGGACSTDRGLDLREGVLADIKVRHMQAEDTACEDNLPGKTLCEQPLPLSELRDFHHLQLVIDRSREATKLQQASVKEAEAA